MQTWSIVSTVRAPGWQVERFIKHYQLLGATQIFLFYDDPEVTYSTQDSNVQAVVCDEGYWKGERLQGLEDRQRYNATLAKNMCTTDWIMHCDIDELCWSRTPISEVLAAQSPHVGGLMVAPREAIYSSDPKEEEIYSTCFFKTFGPEGNPKAYKQMARRMFPNMWKASRCGFWGHVQGKSFIRKSANSGGMPLHHKRNEVAGYEMRAQTADVVLRHFDTMSFDLWRDKHIRRIKKEVHVVHAGKFRKAQQLQIEQAYELDGEAGLKRIYLEMTVPSADSIVLGIESGFVQVIMPEYHLAAAQISMRK